MGGQAGQGVKTHNMHMCMRMCMCMCMHMLFAILERDWPRVHWFSILGMGLVVYLCCFVQFTLYVSKRSVSVKLYQISQSGGLGQSARLFDFNVFMMDITNIDL